MTLSLKDPDTDRLARALAALTGETLTEAIRKALAGRLERAGRTRPSRRTRWPDPRDRRAVRRAA